MNLLNYLSEAISPRTRNADTLEKVSLDCSLRGKDSEAFGKRVRALIVPYYSQRQYYS